MEITWLGHSCFRLRGREGQVITDPYDTSSGYRPPRLTANVVTVSHDDPHHGATAGIEGARVVNGPGEYEIAGIPIGGIVAYRDRDKGKAAGKTTIFRIDMEDVSVVHLGSIGHVPTAEQIEQIGPVSVLLIPVGGHSTIDASAAAETIRLLQPGIAIPMHYKTGPEREELDTIDRFLKEMGLSAAEPQPKLSVSKSSVPEPTQVVVLAGPG